MPLIICNALQIRLLDHVPNHGPDHRFMVLIGFHRSRIHLFPDAKLSIHFLKLEVSSLFQSAFSEKSEVYI